MFSRSSDPQTLSPPLQLCRYRSELLTTGTSQPTFKHTELQKTHVMDVCSADDAHMLLHVSNQI